MLPIRLEPGGLEDRGARQVRGLLRGQGAIPVVPGPVAGGNGGRVQLTFRAQLPGQRRQRVGAAGGPAARVRRRERPGERCGGGERRRQGARVAGQRGLTAHLLGPGRAPLPEPSGGQVQGQVADGGEPQRCGHAIPLRRERRFVPVQLGAQRFQGGDPLGAALRLARGRQALLEPPQRLLDVVGLPRIRRLARPLCTPLERAPVVGPARGAQDEEGYAGHQREGPEHRDAQEKRDGSRGAQYDRRRKHQGAQPALRRAAGRRGPKPLAERARGVLHLRHPVGVRGRRIGFPVRSRGTSGAENAEPLVQRGAPLRHSLGPPEQRVERFGVRGRRVGQRLRAFGDPQQRAGPNALRAGGGEGVAVAGDCLFERAGTVQPRLDLGQDIARKTLLSQPRLRELPSRGDRGRFRRGQRALRLRGRLCGGFQPLRLAAVQVAHAVGEAGQPGLRLGELIAGVRQLERAARRLHERRSRLGRGVLLLQPREIRRVVPQRRLPRLRFPELRLRRSQRPVQTARNARRLDPEGGRRAGDVVAAGGLHADARGEVALVLVGSEQAVQGEEVTVAGVRRGQRRRARVPGVPLPAHPWGVQLHQPFHAPQLETRIQRRTIGSGSAPERGVQRTGGRGLSGSVGPVDQRHPR